MTTATAKTQVELKNIKVLKEMSQETWCYSATIYVNGKKVGTTQNSGHGGSDMISLSSAERAKLEKEVGDLEILFGELISDFLLKQEFKKTMKRVAYIHPSKRGVFELPAKFKPTKEVIQELLKNPAAREFIFLALLPEGEAFELFKKNV